MPGGHTKFSGSWLSYHDSNDQKLREWCKKGKDDYIGYCCLCKVDIKCDNAGKAQLLQHAKRKKHTEVIKHMQSKALSKANCYSVIVKPQVQVKEDLALVKEDPGLVKKGLVLVKEDLALVSQYMVKPHKNKA